MGGGFRPGIAGIFVSQLAFDGQHLGGIGRSNRLESPGYEESTDRYDVRFSGGASQVTIDVV